MNAGNLFANLPTDHSAETIEQLILTDNLVLERITSRGQATPPGQWYDQNRAEWVALLQGSAGLLIQGESEPRVLRPGDYLLIPAQARHRVEWTDSAEPTIWLALHYG
ncbi:MAG: cupin domain-containing protein [SAR324 cluster bacterium]|nr:cupin domain-containing protein [SAR324 cluster bacterium]